MASRRRRFSPVFSSTKAACAVGRSSPCRAESRPGRSAPPAGRRPSPRIGTPRRRCSGAASPNSAAAVPDLGQQRARHAEQAAAARRPRRRRGCRRASCARRWWRRSRGRAPLVKRHSRKRVDRAEGEFAALGARARASDVVEEPGDFRGREIGIDAASPVARASTALARPSAFSSRAQLAPCAGPARRSRCAIGLPRRALPHQRRLALVGDADRRESRASHAGALERLARGRRASLRQSSSGSCSTQPGRG